MKPSERIKEIMEKMGNETGRDPFEFKIGAIWEYLDELYAQGLLVPEEYN